MPSIVLIHSDAGGHPGNAGYLHFVSFNSTPLPAVNQMTLATQYDAQACGVANVKSWAEFYGRVLPSDQQIAWDEGNIGRGCSPQGIVNGLAACGLVGTLVSSTPGPQYVMNPAWGGTISPDQSQPYIDAAAAGWPGGWSVVVTPPATQGDDMGASFYIGQQQHRFFVANGAIQHVWFEEANGHWNGPVPIPGTTNVAGSLSAIATPTQQIVYYTGTDGHQYECYLDKGAWNGPLHIPGT